MLLKVLYLCLGLSYHAVQAFDYRWEDYNGTAPGDAFSVDTDDGKIYIGQAVAPLGRCVGVLKPQEREIEVNCFEYFKLTNKKTKTKDVIKILCADHKEKYVWKQANSETFLKILDDINFVYSGRILINNVNVWVGRYMPPDGNPPMVFGNIEDGIFKYAVNGKAYNVSDSYEALVYVPEEEKPSERDPPCSDIIKEGVNAATEGKIGVGCLDDKIPTPSEIDPSKNKVETNPEKKPTVG